MLCHLCRLNTVDETSDWHRGSLVLGGECRSASTTLCIHCLGPLWAKNRQKFTHHENDVFWKKLSAMSFMKIKSESTHRLIFHKDDDLCINNDFETHTLQPDVTHHILM